MRWLTKSTITVQCKDAFETSSEACMNLYNPSSTTQQEMLSVKAKREFCIKKTFTFEKFVLDWEVRQLKPHIRYS